MSRIRQFAPALLVAIFWIAQVQGTVHAISHLSTSAGVSDRATVPHSLLCVECAGLSQAGAAPVVTPPAVPPAAPRDVRFEALSAAVSSVGRLAAYRSRAPPLSPI
jgi:hypothetical protein